jgi:hypothetical protein
LETVLKPQSVKKQKVLAPRKSTCLNLCESPPFAMELPNIFIHAQGLHYSPGLERLMDGCGKTRSAVPGSIRDARFTAVNPTDSTTD